MVFQKILEIFSYIYTCETISPLMAPPELRGPWSLQTWFCTMLLSFHVLFSFSGTVILLQKIFEICFYKNICKNSFPHCGLTRPLGAMIFTTLILHYMRMLSYKFQHSRPNGSWEEDFLIFSLYITMQNFDPPSWPNPTPRGHDLHNFDSILHEDAVI